jgi:hypothetical protein
VYTHAMKYLLPHAIIGLALLALYTGYAESLCLIALALGHLLVPIWTAAVAPKGKTTTALLIGPILVVLVHALVIVTIIFKLRNGIPEDTWIWTMIVMIWASGLAVYVAYCAISFGIIAQKRR